MIAYRTPMSYSTYYLDKKGCVMANEHISDEELQLYFNYLMKNHGVLNIQDFTTLTLDEERHQYSEEELALEVV